MKRSVKIVWQIFLFGFGALILMLLLANFGVFGKMPSLQELENPEADLASEVISADGQLMGKYYSENRSEVKFNEISPNVINALVATEDERFYDHSGIDAQALARVVFTLGTQGGGSTITQQLAKMILKQGRGNILVRGTQKLKEWIIAVKLERNFTKEEIITLYLNRAPWGNVYGIRNASRTYFQKEPKDLKIEEAAVLVGMLKGFIYEPIRHPKAAIDRRNTVIGQMVVAKGHYLTEAEAAKLKAKPIITNYKQIDENIGIAPYYRRALIEVLKDWCKNNINPKTGEPYDLNTDGLKIYTTIDSRMQKYAEEAMQTHVPTQQRKLDWTLKQRGSKLWKGHENIIENAIKYTERWKNMKEDDIDPETIRKSFDIPVRMKIFSWTGNDKHEKDTVMTPIDSIKYHKQLIQNSFVAMDPRSGEVKAWVGGIDFKWFKFDHVTAKRQVGSTFKPLLYTLAITEAGYTPETQIPGGSLTLGGKTITGGGGTCAYCLAQSKNACAWRLISVIGVKKLIEFAQLCGIKATIPPYYSIALGSAEIPMLQMLQSYTMFPNRGFNTEPVFVSRIEDKNGNLLHEFPIAQSKQVIGEADNYTMVKMMEGVIKAGTARRLNSYNIPTQKAGKTGTTNDNTDGWFIGYTPTLIAGTWVGCDDPFIPIYSSAGGGEVAAPEWGIFMQKVYGDRKFENYTAQKEFNAPAELKNDPIFADANFENILNSGDSLTEEIGNGDASDFLDMDAPPEPTKPVDTNKNKVPKKDDKAPAAIIDDKSKIKKPVPKTPSNTDY
ncbi:transglycosylase domain-containing protein [Ferruginibacter yonginensis]|uniref:Transglycosylase domain-containing protein n=1 Tax=Ferruginibacter yonginensis TaxID=1310416 RepID=A0ABV8QUG1_9BACT